jgi:IclR family mhp operon transcriptional activator
MKQSDTLQTLLRGLDTLALINQRGAISVTELANELRVSRPTAYRLLETLVAGGYGSKVPGTRKYRVTPEVRKLSQGINDSEILTAVAMEPLYELTAKIKWHLALATPSGASMLVRISTDHASTYALSRNPPGQRVSVLNSTTGLLYLALVDEPTRLRLLDAVASDPDLARPQSNEDSVEALLAFAKRNRYLILERPQIREANVGAPLLIDGKPIAGIVMRYTKTALTRDALVKNYVPLLRCLADEILDKFHNYQQKMTASA